MFEETATAGRRKCSLPSGFLYPRGYRGKPLGRALRRASSDRKAIRRDRRAGPATVGTKSSVDQRDAIGFEALLAVDDVDAHPLTGAERVDPTAAQRGDVDEHILA